MLPVGINPKIFQNKILSKNCRKKKKILIHYYPGQQYNDYYLFKKINISNYLYHIIKYKKMVSQDWHHYLKIY